MWLRGDGNTNWLSGGWGRSAAKSNPASTDCQLENIMFEQQISGFRPGEAQAHDIKWGAFHPASTATQTSISADFPAFARPLLLTWTQSQILYFTFIGSLESISRVNFR